MALVGPSNNLTVQMSPSVRADARSAVVQELLQDYFDAINQHDYESWAHVVSSSMSAGQSSDQWTRAYATTVDSSIWVQSMSGNPIRVKLRFTSQQDPSLAPKDLPVDCIHWTVVLQLASRGGEVVVGSTVAGSVAHIKC